MNMSKLATTYIDFDGLWSNKSKLLNRLVIDFPLFVRIRGFFINDNKLLRTDVKITTSSQKIQNPKRCNVT